jgi:large subunit ribosomal protein L18
MNERKILNKIRGRRKNRNRAKIFGTLERPRLSVFRSNRYLSVQLIDDTKGKTLFFASTRNLIKNQSNTNKTNRMQLAEQLGQLIASELQNNGIKKIVFDRGRYKYHGQVKKLAESARQGGLEF